MSKTILITGGARSGKSALAEARALGLTGQATYIATARAGDAEMTARVAAHKARRGGEWTTLEAPLDVCAALRGSDGQGRARLVDCLTLWLSNLMEAGADWQAEAAKLADCLAAQTDPVVLVTNEVGTGIVPANALARAFRDAAGLLNQQIATVADEVTLAVCGLPLKVK